MAHSFTVTGQRNNGSEKKVWGTFTTAEGDTSGTLSNTTHGLDLITDYEIKLDTGGVDTPAPKVTVSAGTLTITWGNDTKGYSGKWVVTGN